MTAGDGQHGFAARIRWFASGSMRRSISRSSQFGKNSSGLRPLRESAHSVRLIHCRLLAAS